jgi:hypothetical protein
MANYMPLMAVLGLLAISAIVGVVILICTLSISNSNGFKGEKIGPLTLSTTVDGIIKGEHGGLTQANAKDITSQALIGWTDELSGDITSNDSILNTFEKLSNTKRIGSVNLVWNQTEEVLSPIPFNAFENRAVAIPVIKNVGKNFDVDLKTGFCTFLGQEEVFIQVNYVITLKLPEISSVSIQHFISLNPNSSWEFASPTPEIIRELTQTYTETTITNNTAGTTTTVILNSCFLIHPNQSFGLCANLQSTNATTVYKHISCICSY